MTGYFFGSVNTSPLRVLGYSPVVEESFMEAIGRIFESKPRRSYLTVKVSGHGQPLGLYNGIC